jgi:hypothetical protein
MIPTDPEIRGLWFDSLLPLHPKSVRVAGRLGYAVRPQNLVFVGRLAELPGTAAQKTRAPASGTAVES